MQKQIRYRRSPLDEETTSEAPSGSGSDGQNEDQDEDQMMEEDPDMLSLAEDPSNDTMLYKKNWHISLFGEIIQDDEDDEMMDHMHPILVNSKGQGGEGGNSGKHQEGGPEHGHDDHSLHGGGHDAEADNKTAAMLTIAYRYTAIYPLEMFILLVFFFNFDARLFQKRFRVALPPVQLHVRLWPGQRDGE